ncbi:uncharacterized protein EI97DRAFT_438179 [Westerdykella ornata]|uniref:Uncharacterized protein n=1 Tax=Westerdykella ornata TaxID=318751 RepID=A0A6A6K063_WESOR|nr:uncharacterized protein EI97DRAFT_438179 [Westerdykella ornata]KAF2280729.1 hypothetical protein EI97DRAFT_438179 [Westerdykella ornata]
MSKLLPLLDRAFKAHKDEEYKANNARFQLGIAQHTAVNALVVARKPLHVPVRNPPPVPTAKDSPVHKRSLLVPASLSATKWVSFHWNRRDCRPSPEKCYAEALDEGAEKSLNVVKEHHVEPHCFYLESGTLVVRNSMEDDIVKRYVGRPALETALTEPIARATKDSQMTYVRRPVLRTAQTVPCLPT